MARWILLSPLALVVALASVLVYYVMLVPPPPLPNLDLNEWWGPERLKEKQDDKIRNFRIRFRDSMINDLKQYLATTREFVPPLDGVGFHYGFNSSEIANWVQYINKYDFSERQKFLNKYPSYKTNIQGLDIHFVHVKPEVPENVKLMPVLMLHGWPGSFREFYEAIPFLTAVDKSRNFALELVIPSLPGYGFSDGAIRPGLGAAQVAVVMRNLMQRLGYKEFYVQGGDWGSLIGGHMATLFPKEVLGFHSNMLSCMTSRATILETVFSIWPTLIMESNLVERVYPLSRRFSTLLKKTGYMHMQATKPDTLGFALSDSPVGLLAYILEKFSTWTDRKNLDSIDGGLMNHFTVEQLLDNFMIYWSTDSIMTSMRLYAESFNKRHMDLKLDEIPTNVPTWALQAKNELDYQPPFILRLKYKNLLHATTLDDGGHFLAFQLPEDFSKDVVTAIGAFREWHEKNRDE